ncbi:MAG: glycosyltransferase family 4 protein [Planctomycetota bacterium]
MRIVQIIPGTGGNFYCENCVRDLALVRALKALGHEVLVVPLYLPLTADDPSARTDSPVFFGAVNLYLSQNLPLYVRAPRWVKRMMDSDRLLKWAASKSGSTRASGLEEMTLSMLRGEEGAQAANLDTLIRWLSSANKPDVIHLSNGLLVGLARRLRKELAVPVVCSLQDEDTWVDAMDERHAKLVWQSLAERADDVDLFVAVSRYYADVMRKRARLAPERMRVVRIGIAMDGYNKAPLYFRPPTLGYVSRMCDSLGLGVLVEAFGRLKRREAWLKNLRLRVTGGYTEDDRAFLEGLGERLTELRMQNDVDFVTAFDAKSRLDFFQTLSVFSVPAPRGEAFGLHVLESLASGVPVVEPAVGGFPELVEETGGGVLYDPSDLDQYVDALASLLLDADKARLLGERGRAYVRQHFTVERMAAEMVKVYEAAVGRR